jgi:hexokinase
MHLFNISIVFSRLAFTFSFPCNQTSLSQATLVSWTKGFSCTSVVGNDVVLMLQEAINRRKVRVIDTVIYIYILILYSGSQNTSCCFSQ